MARYATLFHALLGIRAHVGRRGHYQRAERVRRETKASMERTPSGMAGGGQYLAEGDVLVEPTALSPRAA